MKRPRLNGRSYDLSDPEFRKQAIDPILAELAHAQRKTDPSNGISSEQDKDVIANIALRTAGQLVEVLAGWALDHVYGLSLAGDKLLTVPPEEISAVRRERSDPADRHIHEFAGEQRRYPCAERPEHLTDAVARNLLRNLLVLNPGAFPLWLKSEGVLALDALAFGETAPLFQRDPKGLRVKLRRLLAQVDALAIIEFRYATGTRKAVAVEEICDRLGETPANLKNWKRRLQLSLGEMPVQRALLMARWTAMQVKELKKEAEAVDCKNAESLKALTASIAHPYSEGALKRIAKSYRALRGSPEASA